MNYLDFLFFFFLLLGSIIGFQRGLLRLLGGFLGYVISFLGAATFMEPLAEFIEKNFAWGSALDRWLQSKFPGLYVFFNSGPLGKAPATRLVIPAAPFSPPPSLGKIIIEVICFLVLFGLILGGIRYLTHGFSRLVRRTPLGFFDRCGGLLLAFLGTGVLLGVLLGFLLLLFPALVTWSPLASSKLIPYFLKVFTFLAAKFGYFWPKEV